MIVLTIEASEDAIVTRLAAEGAVQPGQELVAMDSPKLKQQRSHLHALEIHLTFLERPFLDGRIDDEVTALSDKEKILSDAVIQQTQILQDMKTAAQLGRATAGEVAKAQCDLDQSKSAQIDAHLASSHALRKKNDALDKISSAREKIARDKDYLDAMDATLKVVSIINGTFMTATLKGSFVRKGHVIGRIDR